MCNGIMTVHREFTEMTPVGMKFSTLAGTVGGGVQSPGFIGHSKQYILSKKFIRADGGIKRLVWMHKALKDQLGNLINKLGAEQGIENFIDMIADETVATTEEEVLEHLTKMNHPALTMSSMF